VLFLAGAAGKKRAKKKDGAGKKRAKKKGFVTTILDRVQVGSRFCCSFCGFVHRNTIQGPRTQILVLALSILRGAQVNTHTRHQPPPPTPINQNNMPSTATSVRRRRHARPWADYLAGAAVGACGCSAWRPGAGSTSRSPTATLSIALPPSDDGWDFS